MTLARRKLFWLPAGLLFWRKDKASAIDRPIAYTLFEIPAAQLLKDHEILLGWDVNFDAYEGSARGALRGLDRKQKVQDISIRARQEKRSIHIRNVPEGYSSSVPGRTVAFYDGKEFPLFERKLDETSVGRIKWWLIGGRVEDWSLVSS